MTQKQKRSPLKALPLFLAFLLACPASLAEPAPEVEIPLVLLTVTANHSGAPSLERMPPLTDDLGHENPFVTDGDNAERGVFSVQRIAVPAGTEPTTAGFQYNLDGESGQVNYTLNQEALGKVYLYRIALPGLQCTRALLTSPLGGDQFFIFEQIPAEGNTSLAMMASGGPVARLVIFNDNDLSFNLEIRGMDFPVDPSYVVEMSPSNLTTGEAQLVQVSLLDIYSFADQHSYLELNPLPDPSQATEPPVPRNYDLLIYPWADLRLWKDPELTTPSDRQLKGGGSMSACDVAGHAGVVAVLDGPPGNEAIIGYIPKDVEAIDYVRQ